MRDRARIMSSVPLLAVLGLTLSGCGGGGSGNTATGITDPGSDLPVLTLTVGGPKSFVYTWPPVNLATHYKLLEDVTGTASYTQLGSDLTTDIVTYTQDVALYKRDWSAARYLLQSCDSVRCTDAPVVQAGTAAFDAIGYFKASNTGAGDRFGSVVGLSADGMTLAVGAPKEDSAASGIGGNQADDAAPDAGAVYLFTRGVAGWVQQAYIKASNTGAGDRFGSAVALSADGNTLVVGAPQEDGGGISYGNETDDSAADAGAVYVYTRTAGVWSKQAYIKAPNAGAGDLFGSAVGVSGDGNTLLVGAPGESSTATGIGGDQTNNGAFGAGAAYTYLRIEGLWNAQSYIKASNTGSGDAFGAALALSADGNTFAVGATGESSNSSGINGNQNNNAANFSGAVYIYARAGGAWSQQAYVKAFNTGAGDLFGAALALSADGSVLAVGAYQDDSSSTGANGYSDDNLSQGAGAAHIFTRGSSAWIQQAYIKAFNTGAGDAFGVSVVLSGDGSFLAVGAQGEASVAVGLNGTQTDNSLPGAGAVYVYSGTSGGWSNLSYIKASNVGTSAFGAALCLSADGNTLAVGAVAEAGAATGVGGDRSNASAAQAGAVYLY